MEIYTERTRGIEVICYTEYKESPLVLLESSENEEEIDEIFIGNDYVSFGS
ncbi:uncharacterized protein RSE6_14256 [Rhynchosporium secalis]|uniref:Uncharacterized protein n=1 Tax=Rhynchosporium secalis TaxID=38038 RepID=A0A1E1MUW1_RHYSE|nr:uncharacterized protein RSE6_14256 [Rhynchosporium secalis]